MFRVIVILFACLFLTGCGRKAPPVPPEAARPRPPSAFRVILHPFFVELTVRVPVEDIRGYDLRRIKAFEISRSARPAGRPGPELHRTFRVPFGKSPAQQPLFTYRDRDLRPGWCYTYRMRAIKGFRSVSAWTPSRGFCWTTPPRPPENLTARRLFPHTVFLSWNPVTLDLHRFPLHGRVLYRVRRRTPAGETTFPPVPEASFYDTSARAGIRTCYSVEPLLSYYGTLVPGPQSPEVCLIP